MIILVGFGGTTILGNPFIIRKLKVFQHPEASSRSPGPQLVFFFGKKGSVSYIPIKSEPEQSNIKHQTSKSPRWFWLIFDCIGLLGANNASASNLPKSLQFISKSLPQICHLNDTNHRINQPNPNLNLPKAP